MTDKILPTTVVGSYVQPDWLVDRDMLRSMVPPRVRARDIWKIPADQLEDAQDAATLYADLTSGRGKLPTAVVTSVMLAFVFKSDCACVFSATITP